MKGMTQQESSRNRQQNSLPSFKLAFIGLGIMGFPMAGHLLKSGHQVCVYNRNPQKSHFWLEGHQNNANATRAETISEACNNADFIFTCVGNDNDLKEIMLGTAGVLQNAKKGSVVCDHTTSSAKLAKFLFEEALSLDVGFLDAPVSGGQAGAENGALSIMVGGEEKVFESVKDFMECYGKSICLIGEAGSGQLAKMVNQICIAGILEGLSEALHFGEIVGLDLDKVLDVISQGAAQSWQMDNRAKTMLEGTFDFGFAVDWMRKDLSFVMDEARRNKLNLPVVKMVDEYYQQVQALGGGRFDTSSLILHLKNISGPKENIEP
jgi:3-hydroxyisobutyrate dehydrogenase-like beta-hydroxyacid dehydrogenase